jgi:hypothetical protein
MIKIDISQYDLNKALSNFGGFMAIIIAFYAIIAGLLFKQ